MKIISPSSIPHEYRFSTMGQDSVHILRGPWPNSKEDQITIAKFSPLSVSLYFQKLAGWWNCRSNHSSLVQFCSKNEYVSVFKEKWVYNLKVPLKLKIISNPIINFNRVITYLHSTSDLWQYSWLTFLKILILLYHKLVGLFGIDGLTKISSWKIWFWNTVFP